ncbi:MAG: hypothetical protein JXR03_02545 [Cyclobacteriaceae bacterium]
MNKLISTLLSVFLCYACNQTPKESSTQSQTDIPTETIKTKTSEPVVEVTNEQIAKASISALFYQPVNIMTVRTNGNIVFVSYKRPGDGQKFEYKIQVMNNSISWGSSDGRWRNSIYDEKLSYSVISQELVITTSYDDGSKSQERFNIEEL